MIETHSLAPAAPSPTLMRSPLTPGQLLALDRALCLIRDEVFRAARKHGGRPFASGHEGYGVLLEELDELWIEVKRDNTAAAIEEVTQVGAMAAFYVMSRGHQEAANGKD